MTDSTSQAAPSENTPKYSAPKDKSCPYCHQAFTSSSLGRHLDLYVKEKNPKAPDGIHDVEAIKKLRGSITRRQPRNSVGGRKEGSTPAGTPRALSRKDSVTESEPAKSPKVPKDGQYAVDSTLSKFPFTPRWEATGVINDIPPKNAEGSGSWDGEASQEGSRRSAAQRTVSKQMMQKAQLDTKHKLADAMDTARAAELALREVLSSWRAAKVHIDSNSMPFDFDPLSLDFPALTLQCLPFPPTLFSSTQHPTPTSWSIQAPSQKEYDALRAYFTDEFKNWRITCASATTATFEELTYPPQTGPFRDVREAVKKAEKMADNLEKQVNEHLQASFKLWNGLSAQRRNELWLLELARSVGRKQQEADKLKEQAHKLRQENANMKSQIEHLNRLQQPREFKLLSPVTIPLSQPFITNVLEHGVKVKGGVGLTMEDRHLDLSTIVASSIERWKKVITSTRTTATGMGAQQPLDQATAGPAANGPPAEPQSQQQQPTPAQQQPSCTSADAPRSETAPSTTGPPSVTESSDQDADADADAEMEDDNSFAVLTPTGNVPPPGPPPKLEAPRTRAPAAKRGGSQAQNFVMQNGASTTAANRAALNMSRSAPNIQAAVQASMDLGMMQTVHGGGDPMFMD